VQQKKEAEEKGEQSEKIPLRIILLFFTLLLLTP
jgi:hypothetical protein